MVGKVRDSKDSLGQVIHDTYFMRESCWETTQVTEPENVQTLPLAASGTASAIADVSGIATELRNGTPICPQFNTSGCKTPCANKMFHGCDVLLPSGRVCGSKEHKRAKSPFKQ